MAIWKWPRRKFSAVRAREKELADRAQQGREGSGSALQAQDEFRTAEYLQRLDQNVEKDLLLLPSHYASEDYIHFLHDLKRADGARNPSRRALLSAAILIHTQDVSYCRKNPDEAQSLPVHAAAHIEMVREEAQAAGTR